MSKYKRVVKKKPLPEKSPAPLPPVSEPEIPRNITEDELTSFFSNVNVPANSGTAPDWNDIPEYVLRGFTAHAPGASMESELFVGEALKITYSTPNFTVSATLNVGNGAETKGIELAVSSERKADGAIYKVSGKFTPLDMKHAPNAKALYDHLLSKISLESI